MDFKTESYLLQASRWPLQGQHILAQFDESSIIVYQAFNPDIAAYALAHGHFGGGFSFNRMSWIKPNFLWMMFRSGWGAKPGQEVTLAIRLKRPAFDEILSWAVPSSFAASTFADQASWKQALERSPVRLQWDPDHDPSGAPLKRRALQLGLGGNILHSYDRHWILAIEDISDFVRAQRARATPDYQELITPYESVYIPSNPKTAHAIGLTLP